MPKNNACDHYRCDGGPCRMLTPEEIEPSDEDVEEAKRLIQEGWHSTSNKFRAIARFTEPVPRASEMFSPEVLATHHGKRLQEMWDRNRHSTDLRTNAAGVEHRQLTVRLFRAFKKLGGQMA